MKELGKCPFCETVIFDFHVNQSELMSLEPLEFECPDCGTSFDQDDLNELDATFWYASVISNGSQEDKYFRLTSDDGNPEKFINEQCEREGEEVLEISEIDSEEYHEAIGTEIPDDDSCDCFDDDDDEY